MRIRPEERVRGVLDFLIALPLAGFGIWHGFRGEYAHGAWLLILAEMLMADAREILNRLRS